MPEKETLGGSDRLRISKATFPWIDEHEPVQQWILGIASSKTRYRYAYHLMVLLKSIDKTPEAFLSDIEANPKPISIAVKGQIGSLSSRANARFQLCALKSFIAFHEVELKLNGLKVKVPRIRKKPYLPWEDAKKIILECKPPYRALFDFLLWSGLGLDELNEIQGSAEIQQSIEKQRAELSRTYIRIDLRPRKSNIDTYFVLVPKEHVPCFPILTTDYGSRGKQVVNSLDCEMNFLRARRRAGNNENGLGPSTLRSAFRSECGRLGVSDTVAESQMGHGGRERYGYSRETTDETYVASELSKLWNAVIPVTLNELESRDRKIEALEKQVRGMAMQLSKAIATEPPQELDEALLGRKAEPPKLDLKKIVRPPKRPKKSARA